MRNSKKCWILYWILWILNNAEFYAYLEKKNGVQVYDSKSQTQLHIQREFLNDAIYKIIPKFSLSVEVKHFSGPLM